MVLIVILLHHVCSDLNFVKVFNRIEFQHLFSFNPEFLLARNRSTSSGSSGPQYWFGAGWRCWCQGIYQLTCRYCRPTRKLRFCAYPLWATITRSWKEWPWPPHIRCLTISGADYNTANHRHRGFRKIDTNYHFHVRSGVDLCSIGIIWRSKRWSCCGKISYGYFRSKHRRVRKRRIQRKLAGHADGVVSRQPRPIPSRSVISTRSRNCLLRHLCSISLNRTKWMHPSCNRIVE